MIRVGETDDVSYIIKILKNRKLYSYIMKVKISLQKETKVFMSLHLEPLGMNFKQINS